MSAKVDLMELDPGIRDLVALLREAGFTTTDSGDGASKTGMGCALPFPHVFGVMDRDTALDEADRLFQLVDSLGGGWTVEVSYQPAVRTVIFAVLLVEQDELLEE